MKRSISTPNIPTKLLGTSEPEHKPQESPRNKTTFLKYLKYELNLKEQKTTTLPKDRLDVRARVYNFLYVPVELEKVETHCPS